MAPYKHLRIAVLITVAAGGTAWLSSCLPDESRQKNINGCPAASTCQPVVCKRMKTMCGTPAGQTKGLAVFAGGTVYVPGPKDADGCATQGYCRSWTFLECATFYAEGYADPFIYSSASPTGSFDGGSGYLGKTSGLADPGCCHQFYGGNECTRDSVDGNPRNKSYDDPSYMTQTSSFAAH